MKRNVFLLAMVVLMMVAFTSWVVLADRGAAPHDGRCVAYCARADVGDRNGDGKVQNCLVELMCHKTRPDCGKPGWCGKACVLQHGEDTHDE